MTDAVHRPATTVPPYRLYAAIFGVFVLVRIVDLLIRSAGWQYATRESNVAWWVSAVIAASLGWFTGRYLKTRVTPALAFLMCGFAGAAGSLFSSTVSGLCIGLLIGVFAVFDAPIAFCRKAVAYFRRQLTFARKVGSYLLRVAFSILKHFGIILPIGLIVGAAMAVSLCYVPASSATFLLGALIGAAVFLFALRRYLKSR